MPYRLGCTLLVFAALPACSLARGVIGSNGGADMAAIDGGGTDAPITGHDAGDAQVPDVGTVDMGSLDGGTRDGGAADMGTDTFVPPDMGTDMFVPPDMGTDMGPCAACTGTQMCCSLMCFDTTSDPSHCGSCSACAAAPNATSGCVASACTIAVCSGSFRDCNATYADGCEVDTSSSFANCGACGHSCRGMQTCTAGRCVGWAPITATGAPSARSQHTAVWTGTQMIVWGGTSMMTGELNTGGVYDPATDTWTATTMTNAPAARRGHAAVWTGTQMVVWSGYEGGVGWLTDAASYDPVADTWTTLPMAGAPAGRSRFAYAWDTAQSELLVYGGWTNTGGPPGFTPMLAMDAAHFDLATWGATSAPGLGARYYVPGFMTGSGAATRFLVWGGEQANGGTLQTGARYDPAMNTWSNMTNTARPSSRSRHMGVSTGTTMIVWGGWSGTAVRGDGALYDPVGDTWTALAATPAGFMPRSVATAVWTGTEMVVFGGADDPTYGFGTNFFDDAAAYASAGNAWRSVSGANAPSVRADHTAVWTGTEMIVWGGRNATADLGDGARITP